MFGRFAEERAVVLPDWPQPTVVAEPRVHADDSALVIRYQARADKTVVARFPHCKYVVYGAPNDEALGGHPLARRGLEFYSIHEILHSSLIKMLERRNSVHPRHDRKRFLAGLKHYVFTFQDSMLECVANVGKDWKPTVQLFESEIEAAQEWQRLILA